MCRRSCLRIASVRTALGVGLEEVVVVGAQYRGQLRGCTTIMDKDRRTGSNRRPRPVLYGALLRDLRLGQLRAVLAVRLGRALEEEMIVGICIVMAG